MSRPMARESFTRRHVEVARGRRLARFAIVGAASVGLVAASCGRTDLLLSDVVTEETTFELVRIDTDEPQTLPAPVPFGGGFIVSGSFTLSPDGSCVRAMVFSDGEDPPSESEQSWACEWELEGERLSLRWLGAPEGSTVTPVSATEATLEGDRLTLAIDTGIVCVTTPCPTRFSEVYEVPSA